MMQCVLQLYGSPVLETEALMLINLANKENIIVRQVPLLVLIVKMVINFSAAFVKEHGVSFLADRMMDFVTDMVMSISCPAISLKHTSAIFEWQSFLFNALIFSILQRILIGKRWILGHLAYHTLTADPFSPPGQRKDHFWSVPQASTSRTR